MTRKQYYRDPKTEELIVWDPEENELFFIERIRKCRVFSSLDVTHPVGDNPEGMATSGSRRKYLPKTSRRHRSSLSLSKIKEIQELKRDGFSVGEIANEKKVSKAAVYKYTKGL